MNPDTKQRAIAEFEDGWCTENVSDPSNDTRWIKSFISSLIDRVEAEATARTREEVVEEVERMAEGLASIGSGAYKQDPIEHAENCIREACEARDAFLTTLSSLKHPAPPEAP